MYYVHIVAVRPQASSREDYAIRHKASFHQGSIRQYIVHYLLFFKENNISEIAKIHYFNLNIFLSYSSTKPHEIGAFSYIFLILDFLLSK